MKVVFFLLDAFRQDYLSEENTPFLYQKAQQGIQIDKIIPSAGFCERTEIFFGLKPNESGFFTSIGYDEKDGVYKNAKGLRFFGKLEDFFSSVFFGIAANKINAFDHYLHKIVDKLYFNFFGSRKQLKSYKIPHSFLPYFSLTEDRFELHTVGTLKNRKSIFKIIEERGGSTYIGAFTSLGEVSNGDDSNRIRLGIEAIKTNNFVPIYINSIDAFGHAYGPGSIELKQKTTELDSILNQAVSEILAQDPETVIYFLGDHGMTQIDEHIDVKRELTEITKKNGLKKGKDFVYFLDSTLMRIWFRSEKAKNILRKELTKNKVLSTYGVFIDDKLAKQFDIPINDRRYGDMTWWANDGILIFPDFFRDKSIVKGMHGYRPTTKSTFGTCIVWGNKVKSKKIDNIELSGIYHHLIKMMSLS